MRLQKITVEKVLLDLCVEQIIDGRNEFVKIKGFREIAVRPENRRVTVADIHGGDDQNWRFGKPRVRA